MGRKNTRPKAKKARAKIKAKMAEKPSCKPARHIAKVGDCISADDFARALSLAGLGDFVRDEL